MFLICSFIGGVRAMKNKLFIWLMLAGLGIAYIGIKFRNPIVIAFVLGGLGLFSIFSGIQMIITKRADVPTSDNFDAHKERHTGFAAQLYGILFVVFGIIIVFITLAEWLFPKTPLFQIEHLLENSLGIGIFLVIAGALVMIFGIIRLIAGNVAYQETGLAPFERVAGGIYFSLFGLGLLGVGIWLILSPSTLKALFQYLISLIGRLIAG